MKETRDINMEVFKRRLIDILKNEFPETMDRILSYLTQRFDLLVIDYKRNMSKVSAEEQNISLDEDTSNVEDYLVEDENGKIMICGKKYKINPDAFKVINYVTDRVFMKTLRNVVIDEYANTFVESTEYKARKDIEDIIKSICSDYWDNVYRANRRDPKYKNMERENLIENNVINHPSKEAYIYASIHTSVLMKYSDYLYRGLIRKLDPTANNL